VDPRNGLNILPAYLDYFQYNASTTELATASMYIGGSVAAISYNKVTNKFGRKAGMFYAAIITILGTASVDLGAESSHVHYRPCRRELREYLFCYCWANLSC
jgi:fucose permease